MPEQRPEEELRTRRPVEGFRKRQVGRGEFGKSLASKDMVESLSTKQFL